MLVMCAIVLPSPSGFTTMCNYWCQMGKNLNLLFKETHYGVKGGLEVFVWTPLDSTDNHISKKTPFMVAKKHQVS